MENCYPVDCGEYTVAPMLVPAQCLKKYCEQESSCYPRLAPCAKPTYYCCEAKPAEYDCCAPPPQKNCCISPPPLRRNCPAPRPNCDSCCYYPPEPCCKPIKTKYIMPCYRYEDGRIVSSVYKYQRYLVGLVRFFFLH